MRTLVSSYIFLSSLALASPALAADRVAGVIVDQSGQLLPRAFVRVLNGAGRETANAFSDERGGFDLPAPASGCRVEGSLIGFTTASAPCDSTLAIRLVLAVAPVRENVVVSATRTEAIVNQVGASVTTFT
ncbi:MAG TPA: carboxypeptidase-like regulatory domain-containing protein, partial [Vicinamibacterales bacterium]